MGIQRRRLGRSRIALAGTIAVLASAGSAYALQGLPPGGQVNNDPAAGIAPAQSVSGEDPTNAAVAGGAGTHARHRAGDGDPRAAAAVSGSLNFDQHEDGEAPAIDFAGAGRTV